MSPMIEFIRKDYHDGTLEDIQIHASGFEYTSHFKTEVKVDKSKLD